MNEILLWFFRALAKLLLKIAAYLGIPKDEARAAI